MKINKDIINTAEYIGNYLNLYLSKNQGVLLGEHTVVSRKVHMIMPKDKIKGRVKILMNRDAGIVYKQAVIADQFVHLDTYHMQMQEEINFPQVLLGIFFTLEQYFNIDNKDFNYSEEMKLKELLELSRKIYISCNVGQGTLYNLLQKGLISSDVGEKDDHIHILVKIDSSQYALLYVIALAVEDALLKNNIKLARISKIFHEKQKYQEDNEGNYMKLPWRRINGATILDNNNQITNQLLLKLAEKFGSIEDLEDFLDAYANSKNKRFASTNKTFSQPHIEQMLDMEIIKKHLLGMSLTKQGEKLKKYLSQRRCELQMDLRRNMRRIPEGSKKTLRGPRKLRNVDNTQIVNYARTLYSPHSKWEGNLAVPQTIIQAKKNNLLRRQAKLSIQKSDLHRYANKSNTPVNICLLLDCSASMTGRKKQSVMYVAEHLLLSGKDKVAVVIFQGRLGRVVVPFTRQEKLLHKGLLSIKPAGLTPLAQGLEAACQLIKKSRVKNPLLVLITDGLPNVALWSRNPEADALKAAEEIKRIKGKFICVGIESKQEFLNKICEQVKGTFYLTEEFNRKELIRIIRYERKNILNNK